MIDELIWAGTLLAALATLPQMWVVIKNRTILNGYNPIASFALFIAMIAFASAFWLMQNWFSVLCEVPIAIFWLTAALYSWKNKK